jgi:hypothetical protein
MHVDSVALLGGAFAVGDFVGFFDLEVCGRRRNCSAQGEEESGGGGEEAHFWINRRILFCSFCRNCGRN